MTPHFKVFFYSFLAALLLFTVVCRADDDGDGDDDSNKDNSKTIGLGSSGAGATGAPSAATGTAAADTAGSTGAPATGNVLSTSVGGDVSYAVNIPSAGSSDLYLQIRAPTSMSWVALAQGSQMTASNMFIIYSNAAGTNVTLSPRLGTGDVEPKTASTSSLSLLAGSGITGGFMTANILCTNCQQWTGGQMDFTSSSTSWIWAYKSGSPLATDSTSASISQHDEFGSLSIDLASATGGSSTNPFLSAAVINNTGLPNSAAISTSSSSENEMLAPVHGSLAFLAFVTLFPIGGIILRLFSFKGLVWAHAGLQMFAYLIAIVVLITGVILAAQQKRFFAAHPILGFLVVGALFFQPLLGFAHHLMYKTRDGRSVFRKPHIIWGRVFITLGIVNVGLGLHFSSARLGITVAYSVIAVLMWSLWIGSAIWAQRSKGREAKREKEGAHRLDDRVDERSDHSDERSEMAGWG